VHPGHENNADLARPPTLSHPAPDAPKRRARASCRSTASHWQVNSADNLTHETIAFSNAAVLHAADWHLS
jgi:hypothetical protein